jgi:hypothetical protein
MDTYPVSDIYSYPNTDHAFEVGYNEDESSVAHDMTESNGNEMNEMDPGQNQIHKSKKNSSWKDDDVFGLVPSHLKVRRS